MVLSVTWNGTAYSIPQSGERGWATLTTFLQALATSAQSTGKQLIGRRTATASPITVTATTDAYVGVNVSAAVAAVNLPAGVNGQVFIIADESDAANTYNITINPAGANTINSTTSYVMSRNSQAVMLIFSGSDWVVIANGSPSNPIVSVTDSAQIDLTLSSAGALSGLIVAGSIANVDISASAAIAYSKLAALTSANILVGSAGNVATVTAVTGDVTINNTGVTAIASGVIVNDDVNASAAIARTKIASGTADHVIINDGSGVLSSSAQLASTKGGTGVSNAGTLTYGANNITLTTGGATGVTLPTTGTLATLAGSEVLTGKTLSGNIAVTLVSGAATVTLPTTTGTLATLANAEQFTNKDYDGGTASNSLRLTVPKNSTANLAALTRKQGTIAYDTTLNKLKYDDGSNLNLVGSGSGSGGINYISNADFEDGSVTGWTAYADAAATTPVDGTGGAPTATFAINSSSPLRGTYDAVLTKDAANRQGEGVAYAFTLAAADVSKTLQLTFDSKASANLASGDVTIYVYDVTNSVLITPSSINVPTGTSSQYSLAFQATTSTSYRLIFHIASTNATAYTLELDQLTLSPVVRPMVAGESDWIAYTPTITSMGTATLVSSYWRRIGDTLVVRGSFSAGTTTASLFSISIPTGLTINSTKLSYANTTAAAGNVVGIFSTRDGGKLSNIITATATSTTLVYAGAIFSTAAGSFTQLTPQDGSSICINTDLTAFQFEVPITSWSSNITLASTTPMIEYVYNTTTSDAADTTAFGYGAGGGLVPGALTAARLKRIRFQNPIQPTDRIVVEVRAGTTGIWMPVSATDSGFIASPLQYQNAVTYGLGYQTTFINSTDLDIAFGQYKYPSGATYGAAGAAWAGTNYWRVAKYSAIGGAELAPATATSGGTVSGGTVPGITSGTAIAAGYMGEALSAQLLRASATALTTSTAKTVTSITLTPGRWLLYANTGFTGTSTAITVLRSELSLTTDTTNVPPSGAGVGFDDSSFTIGTATATLNVNTADVVGALCPIALNYSVSTTIYIVSAAVFSSGTVTAYGRLQAVRVG